ncbi:hypothetical protein P8452_59118 [Trifolium repens]|nr:hypothetical protein P8452_59118 [Trifolium repens]
MNANAFAAAIGGTETILLRNKCPNKSLASLDKANVAFLPLSFTSMEHWNETVDSIILCTKESDCVGKINCPVLERACCDGRRCICRHYYRN